jgi:hypothetical protein
VKFFRKFFKLHKKHKKYFVKSLEIFLEKTDDGIIVKFPRNALTERQEKHIADRFLSITVL